MRISVACFFIFTCLTSLNHVSGLAVMSVDLGSEWIKIGIVSPGVPMEIALNKESKRKTPAVISFRDNVRSFGEDAQTVGIRFPKNAYSYILDLLGKNINHPLVKLYQKRFPHYDIVENSERGTILFKHDNDTYYSPEELLAQLLVKAKEFAEQGAHQVIKECVITVPGYFNQAERKALLQAAQLANIKVLQLINDYMAVALNYGIFRSKDFNESAQYVMFYDMGASSTTATIVSYQNIKTKERGYVETHPQVSIIGVGFDRTLGGLEIQLRLRDYLANKFNEMKKTKKNVFDNSRAMAKLFKEAGRLKNVLSANAEHVAQIEGLLDEQDFKVPVTREDLEGLITDLLERVKKPVEQALKAAHLTKDLLSQVVLFGAGTRVPKIQEILQSAVGQDLAKNINTDESAALGAVYKAADLSTGFQVKKFITKDAVIYPIQIVFERDGESGVKQFKRTLFGLMNPYPQKKIITFNKHTTDFTFKVNYADLEHLPDQEILNLGPLNLTEATLVGVEEAIRKNSGENVESKGIKAHFQMDESGILNLINVEYVVEKKVTEAEEEGTLSKLGSTISKLFGGEEEKPVEEKPVEEKPVEEKPVEEKPTDGKPEVNGNFSKVENATKTANKTETKDTKPKIITLKEPIKATEKILTLEELTKEQIEESRKKLKHLEDIEKALNRRATALNNLESFVIDVQTKLDEDDYSEAVVAEEKEKIAKTCSEISDWLYDEGADADAETYENKLKALQEETRGLFSRVWEHRERPEALKALNSMLNQSEYFLASAKNFTKSVNPDKDIFTDSEVQSLEKIINETHEWKLKAEEDQNKLKKYEAVKLTVKSITDKMGVLDREVKYLVHKLKVWKPRKPEKVEEKVKAEKVNDSDYSGNEEAKVEDESDGEEVEPSKSESTKEADESPDADSAKGDKLHTEL